MFVTRTDLQNNYENHLSENFSIEEENLQEYFLSLITENPKQEEPFIQSTHEQNKNDKDNLELHHQEITKNFENHQNKQIEIEKQERIEHVFANTDKNEFNEKNLRKKEININNKNVLQRKKKKTLQSQELMTQFQSEKMLLNKDFETNVGIKIQNFVKEVVAQETNFEIVKKGEETHINVQIYPENLGRVNAHLMVCNQTLTLFVHTSNEKLENMIENKIDKLKKALQEEGFQDVKIEINTTIKNEHKHKS